MLSTGTFVLAFALSADAFAASLAKGAQHARLTTGRSVAVAGGFATLEALAPLIGWLIGSELGHWIAHVDHWVAFGLLGFMGLRMIRLGLRADAPTAPLSAPTWLALFAVALGTSVDAMAVGVTLALVTDRILPTIAAIAAVTFAMTWIGLRLGHVAGTKIGRFVETLGGFALIAIGTKILIQHLAA